MLHLPGGYAIPWPTIHLHRAGDKPVFQLTPSREPRDGGKTPCTGSSVQRQKTKSIQQLHAFLPKTTATLLTASCPATTSPAVPRGRPHVTVKWMHTVGVAVVTVLQLVSDTQLSPANPSALQLSFTNPTRSAQVHRLQRELSACSPGETTPGRGNHPASSTGLPNSLMSTKDRPAPSPRDKESSSYTSPNLGWEPTSPGPAPLLCQHRYSHWGSRDT